jgi:hypothetical protein
MFGAIPSPSADEENGEGAADVPLVEWTTGGFELKVALRVLFVAVLILVSDGGPVDDEETNACRHRLIRAHPDRAQPHPSTQTLIPAA